MKWILVAVLLAGCASQKVKVDSRLTDQFKMEPTAIPSWTPTVVVEAIKKVEVAVNKTYVVVKGDSLWKIAGKKETYGDSLMWPIILKDNRSQIVDQDFIYPGQALVIEAQVNDIDAAMAKIIAIKTPKYHKHKKHTDK